MQMHDGQLDKLRAYAADCALISELARDVDLRKRFRKLSLHLSILVYALERAAKRSDSDEEERVKERSSLDENDR